MGVSLIIFIGMMKKTEDANNPNYTFSFLHLTLQEYLSAFHLSIGQSYNRPGTLYFEIVVLDLDALCSPSLVYWSLHTMLSTKGYYLKVFSWTLQTQHMQA